MGTTGRSILLALGSLAAAGLLLGAALKYGLFSEVMAAWVQAIGSVAAILAAIAVAGWQGVQQRSIEGRREEAAVLSRATERRDKRRKMLLLAGLVRQRLQVTVAALTPENIKSVTDLILLRRSVDNELRPAETFDPLDIDDYNLIKLYLVFPGLLGSASDQLGAVIHEVSGNRGFLPESSTLAIRLSLIRLDTTAADSLEQLQRALGAREPGDVQ